MLTNVRRSTVLRRISQLAAGAALLALASCGGSSLPAGGSRDVIGLQFDPGLPPLLELAATAHQASAPVPHTLNGSDAIAKSDAAAVLMTSMEIPSGPGTAEWAVYQFATGGEPLLDLAVEYTNFTGISTWVGLGNFTQGAWEFNGTYPVSGAAIDVSGGDYVSPGDDFFFVVVTFNGTFSTVDSATINTNVGPTTYAVSGTVLEGGSTALPAVQMTLSPGDMQTMTDESGNYMFTGVSNGSYTVTPALAGYEFSPASQNANVMDEDVLSVDFSATAMSLVTYTSDIQPLLATNCVGCHNDGFSAGGIRLDTYAQASANANAANGEIQSGGMPPGGPLSAEDKALFQQWLDDGKPE